MVAPLRTASIQAPAFYGLNTMDSEVTLDPKFARSAENCIIDEGGRIGSRLGWSYVAQTATPSTAVNLKGMHRFVDINGIEYFGAWSDDAFYIADLSAASLTAVTYSGAQTITEGNWQAATLNDAAYLFQSGYEPIYFNPTSGVLDDVTSADNSATVTIANTSTVTAVNTYSVTLTNSGTVATASPTGHNLATGDEVIISGANESEYNGTFTVTVLDDNTYEYTMSSSPSGDATGTTVANTKFAVVAHTGHGFETGQQVRINGANEAGYNGTFEITVINANGYYYTMLSIPTQDATGTVTASVPEVVVTHTGHPFITGDEITVSGATPTAYNGTFTITVIDTNSYYYVITDIPTSNASGTITATWDKGEPPWSNTVLSAYGRIWAAGSDGSSTYTDNKTTVYWSDLLDGTDWNSGTSGSLDISGILVYGNDEIVGLGAHNGRLIIFCKNNIIIMDDQTVGKQYLDPADMSLVEVINGVGCVSRDSIVNTGTDIMFLSESGVRALSRTIQEKSQPMRDISRNIRDTLVDQVARADETKIRAVYSDHFAFYLLSIPDEETIWCFDMRAPLQNGSARVTRWNGLTHTSWIAFDGSMYMTNTQGVAEYKGYQDNGSKYSMQYYTNYFDFGMSNRVKIVKNIASTVIGSTGQKFVAKIGTDYEDIYTSYNLTVKDAAVSEFGIAEYGLSTTTSAVSQAADTITDHLGDHYTVDFSTTEDDTYDTELKVWLDADTYYYTTDDGTRTRTTLYVKSVDFTAEYAGAALIDNVRIPAGGSGFVIQLGFESEINGGFLSIQQIDLYVKQGRLN